MIESSLPNFSFDYPGYAPPTGVVNFKFGENEYRGFAEGVANVLGYGVAWDPIRSITGTAAGVGAVLGSFETPTPTVGTSTGISDVSGVGILVQETEGISNGINLTLGVLSSLAIFDGSVTGSSVVSGQVSGLIIGVGFSAGISTVNGGVGSYAGLIGSAVGASTVFSVPQGVIQTTGIAEGSGSALASSGRNVGINFNFNITGYSPPVNPNFDFIPDKPSGFVYSFSTVNGVSSYLKIVTITGVVTSSGQALAVGTTVQKQKYNNSVVMLLM